MNMNTKKKLRKRIALALASIMLLTGCQSGTVSESVKASAEPVSMEPTDKFVIYRPPNTPTWLAASIVQFRQIYKDVQVTIEDFSTQGTYEERLAQYRDRVNNELMTGSGPDIIFPAYLNLNPNKAMQGKIFLNLTPFFEQDKNFNPESFLPGVLEAGQYQGKQYIIPIFVTYPAFLARLPILERVGIDEVASGDMISFLEQLGEASVRMEQDPNFDRMMDDTMYFNTFFEFANLKLVDYENKQVCQDTEALRNFMEAYKNYYEWDYNGGQPVVPEDNDLYDILPERSCFRWLYCTREYFTTYGSAYARKDGGYSDFLVGDKDGKITAVYQDYLAVPSNSKNQLNAYRFIQIMLSNYIQAITETHTGVTCCTPNFYPVSREALGLRFQDQVEDAIKIICRYPAIPREESLAHKDKLLQVNSSVLPDFVLEKMVWEAMEPFFKDEKPYEACFDELKSKLTLYMDE